jgi:signal transduction histidine kinase/ActR/RegA family two-component response regulator
VLETGTWQGELLQATKAARELVVLSSWTLMRDLAGKPKSILTITTDITAQKRIEAQTLRAQRMESTGRLASGIAHDLNNVLAPILMALQMLREQAKDESAQALLQTLETSAKRGGDIVRQVQIFARGIEGERIPLNAKHLIREMERIAGATFSRNIKTCAEAPPGLWLVTGDATQLHQVLMNLCVNARDAMPYGGTLALAAENVTLDDKSAAQLLDAKAGHYVRLTVADTGSGIAPEILDKIFDPFFTTKGSDKGTGLGLSTVLGIVRSHGGFVEVQSKVGYGSRFEVYLPAIPESQPAAVAAQRQAPPQGQGETILVVDDEQTFREVTEGTLTQNGYKALTANDGTEAIALFAQNRDAVKVVLIDMMMPFMDGPATIRAMRRLNPQIKLIGVSGLSAGALPPDVARLELQAFLHKPFTAEALLTALHEAICHADISH